MKPQDRAATRARKREIAERQDRSWHTFTAAPVTCGANLSYEVSSRVTGVSCGGIGLVDEMVRSIGLREAIDTHVPIFKCHHPYFESDHVMALTYNVMMGGTCIEDLELLRKNTGFLDTIGATMIPDPTTAGDFLRRFECDEQIAALMEAINDVRVKVWTRLPKADRSLALVDVDGTIAPTLGEYEEGMDLSYKGEWGYHPLIVSLANTGEVLYVKNRPGNRPSHDDSPAYLNAAVTRVRQGGFEKVRLRGDTDFALTAHFDRWTEQGVEFVFGMDANPTFVNRAEAQPQEAWRPLVRHAKYDRQGAPRDRGENVKELIIVERGFKSLALESEHYAEITYQPGKAVNTYRLVVVRKTIRVTEGQRRLADEIRYHFYVTNVDARILDSTEVVFQANARCHQENIIEQLKNGVHAMRMPSNDLRSNWAYVVIAALAWNLKAWLSILLPFRKEAQEIRRMEFRRFLNSMILVPCQIVNTARRVVLRLIAYSEWTRALIDGLVHFKRLRLT